MSLSNAIEDWNHIAKALAEPPRRRTIQLFDFFD